MDSDLFLVIHHFILKKKENNEYVNKCVPHCLGLGHLQIR